MGRVMQKRLGSRAGFSLTEMSLALAVMVIMAVMVVGSAVNRLPGYRLDESIRQLSGDLMLARSMAAAINERVTVFIDDGGAYRIWADRNGNGTMEAREVEHRLLEYRREVEVYSHPQTLTFRPTGRLADDLSFVYIAAQSKAGYEHFFMLHSGQILWSRD